jgi:hypothetical protein
MGESFRREPLTRESVTRDSVFPVYFCGRLQANQPPLRCGYFFTSIEPFMLGWRAQL